MEVRNSDVIGVESGLFVCLLGGRHFGVRILTGPQSGAAKTPCMWLR